MVRFERLDDAARLLAGRAARTLPFSPEWHALESPKQEREGVAAVDGSHAVLLDNGAAWVIAERAAAIRWPGANMECPVTVHAAGPETAQDAVDTAYEAHGLEAPPIRSADAFAEALRGLAEWVAARDALKQLPANGILLVDGALERLPMHAAQLAATLLEFAGDRDVVGVAKRSRLDADGTPMVTALQRLASQERPGTTWRVSVPGYSQTHVACLHPQAKHAFRVDATRPEAVADLLPLCRDAVYTGYPYPLAVAHNAVAITHAQARTMQQILAESVHKQGLDVRHILDDFHDVLDRNAPR